MFSFKVKKKSNTSPARTGVFSTPHGEVQTPIFMPCGTKATVKSLSPYELEALGCQILLGNTYHLHLRPGSDLILEAGGLHKFMNWKKPILTDSGGFQVFSLKDMVTGEKKKNSLKLTENGVEFYSYIDGSKHIFSPKNVIGIQRNLGSDVMMVIDECADGKSSKDYAISAMQRTHDWALKCFSEYVKQCDPNKQTLFPIVQGVTYEDLRIKSAKFVDGLGSLGVAIGGLSVGEPKETMYRMVECLVPYLKDSKPRYLMGVGTPEDLIENVYRGIDMFDCVLPTRLARHGAFYDETGRQNILNKRFEKDFSPISNCPLFDLNKYSKAYVRHLMKEKEILGVRILSMHNLWFLFNLMEQIREAINNDRFDEFRLKFYTKWEDYKPDNL